jgi:hypothetical protein
MAQTIQSPNGTIFYQTVYTKTGTDLRVLSTEVDGIPCGIIMPFIGHGDWIYFEGHAKSEDVAGLQLLEHKEIETYIASIRKELEKEELEETEMLLKLLAWDAHKIMSIIHMLERHNQKEVVETKN